MSLNNLRS